MEKNYTTYSVRQTQNLARTLLKEKLQGPILLVGNLGSGKTTFVKGLAWAMGTEKTITSPSFLLCREYDIKHNSSFTKLFHYDLYRLRSYRELLEIGFEEKLIDNKTMVVIEWSNKIRNLVVKLKKFQKQPIIIKFYHTENKNQRKISVKY